ncbi:serum paraoxonase/arylesterase 1-like [Pecten maximus]|uniref:serum paraoxonase/arylesterase 1-like n=1 Tax=Pecten maximus TaxID=6579 RepID=UPI001458A3F6|nr:serum paraoxonase/arylesterase 1-like [Pecten maximus]
MIKSLVFTAILVLVVQHAVRIWFFLDYHKTEGIIHHRPGPCLQLDGADGGSEDLTVLDNGLTFISSGYFSWTRGRILLFDLAKTKSEVKELHIISSSLNQSDLSFHGLSAWHDSKTGETTVMVVNHAGSEDQVEVFTFQKDSSSLLHVETIICPKLKFMNDLVMTSSRTFYITKFSALRENYFLEGLLLLKFGEILYYDGSDFRNVAQGLHMPNGINTSPDKRYLYVSEFGGKQLKSYSIVGMELEPVEDLYLDTHVDNIEVEPTSGNLWVGCHPSLHRLASASGDVGSLSPSQILMVRTTDGKFKETVDVYSNSGSELKASTVASVYKGKMIAGTLGSQLIVCDLQTAE